MSFFFISLYIQMRKLIFSPLFACTAALILTLIPACAYFLNSDNVITVNVGVLAQSQDALSNRIINELMNSEQINFIVYSHEREEEMTEHVKNRRLECAYILKENLSSSILEERYDTVVTILTSPATSASPIVNEIFHAAVMNASAPLLSARFTSSMFGDDEAHIVTLYEQLISDYHANGVFIDPVFVRLNEYEPDITDPFALRILTGVWITTLFIFALLSVPGFIREKRARIHRLLKADKVYIYYASQFCALFISQFILAGLALTLVHILAPQSSAAFPRELLTAGVYIAVISAVMLLIALVLKSAEPIYSSFVFLLMMQIMFGNVFIDISEVSSFLGRLAVLPSAYYMNNILYSEGFTVPAILFAVALLSIALIINKERLKQH